MNLGKTKAAMWVEEPTGDFLKVGFRADKVLFSGKSEFQSVDVIETRGHGKMLLNDGLVMLTERDEFIYHDMITHVPMFTHPNPKSVLVIGGGDGGTAREVLRHQSVESVVMVEIDGMVVDACKEFIPQTSSELSNKKLELIIGDGVEYVATTKKKFDVVIVDSTDPIGPATPLFGTEFYKNIYNILNDDGIVVSQAESPFYFADTQKSLLGIIGSLFPIATIYNFNNMGYPGGFWSFTFASKGAHPIKNFDESKVKASGLEFGYYNEKIHQAAFCLPSFQYRKLVEQIKD